MNIANVFRRWKQNITNWKARALAAEKTLEDFRNPSIEFLKDGWLLSSPDGGFVGFFLKTLVAQFIEAGAKNYLELQVRGGLKGGVKDEFVITIQKKNGKTPHELRIQAEKERDELRELLEYAVSRLVDICVETPEISPFVIADQTLAELARRQEKKEKAKC
jgi:hypothetical protein